MSANSKAGAPTRRTLPQPARVAPVKKAPEAPPKAEPAPAAVPDAHGHGPGHDHDHDHEHVARKAPRVTLDAFHAGLAGAKDLGADARGAMAHMARTLEGELNRGKPRTEIVRDLEGRLRTMVGSFTSGGTQTKLVAALDALAPKAG